MKHFAYLGIILVGLASVSCRAVPVATFHPGNKISPAHLQEDLTLLKNILEANHPSMYWYTPKDSIDHYFAIAQAALQDSLTEIEFKNKVAWVISKIKCGHTVVRHSKAYNRYFQKNQAPVFPLAIKVWQDSTVIAGNLHRKDSILKRGTIITAINNRPMQSIVDSMFALMSTDGHSINFKYQVTSFNFPAYYRNAFNLDSQYVVHYMDSLGNKNHTVIRNYYPKVDTARQAARSVEHKLSRKQRRAISLEGKRSLFIDTSLSTAILNIHTFSEGRLHGFYRRSFKKIKQLNLKNVVLDLRQNSGGNILSSTRLTQYLADKPYKIADTVAAISRSFPYKQHIKPWFLYWISMQVTGRKMSDNRIHFRYFERHYFHPKKKNHFDGKIYVVAGGYTFSAATLVTGALIQQKNVTVVGEETGGGAYGNSAMHLPGIILPRTHLRLSLPIYRIVVNQSLPKNGRGILPDIEVPPSSYFLKQGIDGKLQKVREMIMASKNL